MQDTPKLGFIGLGSMGGDQVRELVKLPNPLTVYDIAPKSLTRFEGKATIAANMGAVGEDADMVGICVQDDIQVMQCVDAVLPVMKPDSVLLVHSTVRPATILAIGERARASGVHVLDAPVSRTSMASDGPFVFCMTGGDEAVAARVQGLILSFATDTLHVGPLGSAMSLKICNNLASWCAIMIGLEAVDLAAAAGVPIDKLLTVMKRNGVLTPPAQGFVDFRNNPGDANRRSLMAVQAGIGEKDLLLAEDLARGAEAPIPIGSRVRTMIKEEILRICNS